MNEIILNVLSIIVTMVIIPLITWGGTTLIGYINVKCKNVKGKEFLTKATEVVANAVKTVFQTYVDSLKKSGKFDNEAQYTALNKAKALVKQQLSNDVKQYIEDNYGSFENWITIQIESTIDSLKNK